MCIFNVFFCPGLSWYTFRTAVSLFLFFFSCERLSNDQECSQLQAISSLFACIFYTRSILRRVGFSLLNRGVWSKNCELHKLLMCASHYNPGGDGHPYKIVAHFLVPKKTTKKCALYSTLFSTVFPDKLHARFWRSVMML